MAIVAQLFEYSKYLQIIHFKWVNCIICKLYLNRAASKNKKKFKKQMNMRITYQDKKRYNVLQKDMFIQINHILQQVQITHYKKIVLKYWLNIC